MSKYKHNSEICIRDKNHPFYLQNGFVVAIPTEISNTYLIRLKEYKGHYTFNLYVFYEEQIALSKLKSFI